jgi:hypothetical protein
VNTGLPTAPFISIALQGGVLYTGTVGWGVYRTKDGGELWKPTSTGLTSLYVRCLLVNGSNIFAGTSGGVYGSTNSGEAWSRIEEQSLASSVQCFAVATDRSGHQTIFAGTSFGAVFSTDNGATWSKTEITGALISVTEMAVQPDGNGGSVVFAGTNDRGVFVSYDFGMTWTEANAGLENKHILSMQADEKYAYAGTTDAVYRRRNGATAWVKASNGMTETPVHTLAVRSDESNGIDLFAGTTEGGLFYSSDNGKTWVTAGAGLPAVDVISLEFNDGYLYAGTDTRGVWRRPLEEITGKPIVPVMDLVLHQNYPNPFGPFNGNMITSVDYELPEAGNVSLSVYNTAGMKVATIFEGYREEGRYTAEYDASALPAGVYVCRLVADGAVRNRKMTVVR